MATEPTAPITLKSTVGGGKYVDVMIRATELANDDLGSRANALYVLARAGMETPRFKHGNRAGGLKRRSKKTA